MTVKGIKIRRPRMFQTMSTMRRAALRVIPLIAVLVVLFGQPKPAKANLFQSAPFLVGDVVCQCSLEAVVVTGSILVWIFG